MARRDSYRKRAANLIGIPSVHDRLEGTIARRRGSMACSRRSRETGEGLQPFENEAA
jgi:hypothetical protein